MITLDRDTRLERVRESETMARHNGAVLAGSTVSTTTPWLAAALSALYELQQSGRYEAGVGDLRVNPETAQCAGRVLGSVRFLWLPTPDVGRVSGGGIAFRWTLQDDTVELLALPNDEVLVTYLRDGDIDESQELKPSQYGLINGMLKRLLSA